MAIMRISRLTWQRIIGISLGLLTAFFMANYYLGLGFFGRGAKGLLILMIGLGIMWGAFFAPTRQALREDRDSRRAKRDS